MTAINAHSRFHQTLKIEYSSKYLLFLLINISAGENLGTNYYHVLIKVLYIFQKENIDILTF